MTAALQMRPGLLFQRLGKVGHANEVCQIELCDKYLPLHLTAQSLQLSNQLQDEPMLLCLLI